MALSAITRRLAVGSLALLTAAGALTITAASSVAAPTQRYVATDGSDGSGDSINNCAVKTSPCQTIQHGVDESDPGDTVNVGAGTYNESVGIDKSLSVIGSTSGTTTVTAGTDDAMDIFGAEGTLTVALSHLVLTKSGLGLDTDGANVTITDSSFTDNASVGIGVESGTVQIAGSRLNGNGEAGAGIVDGALTITDSTLNNNLSTAGGPVGLEGAGIEAIGSGSVSVTRSTLADNDGPGVLAIPLAESTPTGAPVTVSDSTLSGNHGPGLFSFFSSATKIADSTVQGNGEAGVLAVLSTVTVDNSTVSGTTSVPVQSTLFPGQGGVVAFDASVISAERTSKVVSAAAKKSRFGQAAAAQRRTAKVTPAAALPDTTTITLSGSIVADNGTLPDCSGPVTDKGYNLSSDTGNTCKFATAGHDVVKTDPKLGALADNGGPTFTRALGTTSAARDAIPTGAAGCVSGATDQRGVARPQGPACDIGAVEMTEKPVVIHPASLPHGTVGEAYHVAVTATGGKGFGYVWSLAPGTSLPAGLSFSKGGILSGTPTKAGTYSVTVSVDDPTLKTFRLVIEAAAVAPNDNGSAPIANTGANVLPMSTVGGLAVLIGFAMLVGAGFIGRRPGRHRSR